MTDRTQQMAAKKPQVKTYRGAPLTKAGWF